MVKRPLMALAGIFNNKLPVLALIGIYPLLFIWQGLDFTDTGYILTNYQQIFIEPSSVEASFRTWLTNVLGGLWIYFFGDSLGLVGYRFAAVLLTYATLYTAFLTLKPYFDHTRLLWGLFLALIFINRSGFWMNYNSFTAFFYVLGAYYLIRGVAEQQRWRVFAAGFLLSLNIFVRLPNVLGFALVLSIFFFGFTQKIPISSQLKLAGYFILGYLASIISVLIIMYLMGHLRAYAAVFKGTFSMLRDPVGHHRSDKLIDAFVRHHKTMIEKLWYIFIGSISLTVVLSFVRKFSSFLLQFAIILGSTICLGYYYFFSLTDWVNMLIVTVGVLYIIHAALIVRGGRVNGAGQAEVRLVSFVSLLVLFLVPLGSNVAIRNSIYGMYLAIPLVFAYIGGIREVNIPEAMNHTRRKGFCFGLSGPEVTMVRASAVILFVFFTVLSTYFFTYRDSADRSAMAYPVDHPRLKGVLTTKDRALVVEELLKALPKYVKEGDYLLAYEQVSMIHFLTKTKPYIYSAWPMLYSPGVFKEALDRATKERSELPVIVRAKGNTENFDWPKKGHRLLQTTYHRQNRQAVDYFIRKNDYKSVWENSFFEILVPPTK